MPTGFDPSTITDSRLIRAIEFALIEDSGLGDLTSEAIVEEDAIGKGEIICKDRGIIAGLDAAAMVFHLCDESSALHPDVSDGEKIQPGKRVALVSGLLRGILRGERVALNLLHRMSGIATLTRAYVDAVAGTRAKITDTRKTAPGLRAFDKWAVRAGGGVNHRFGLDDMVLIKDNHIAVAGGIAHAAAACTRYLRSRKLEIKIEVETTSLEEVREALDCQRVFRIMLDNFAVQEMAEAVRLINGRAEVEASGGITLENVRACAETGVDLISVGALTHSSKALDLSLEIST